MSRLEERLIGPYKVMIPTEVRAAVAVEMDRGGGIGVPGPRICGGMEAAPPGSDQLRRLRDLIGQFFLPYQPDSRDCIIFNARKFHLNYD